MSNTIIDVELNEKPFSVDLRGNLATAHKVLEELMIDLSQETQNELDKELQRMDVMIQDILHIIEFMSFNAVEGYKFAKMLQEIRKARRKIKNRMEERRQISNLINAYKSSDFRSKLNSSLKNVEKIKKLHDNRSYRLRQLSDLEPFTKVIEEQKKKMNIV
ncbi:hypothetical protein NUG13_12160 [Bacillus subtilis]|nr:MULTISPECIES: hypothetical protein [Bacillus subtilis group]MCR4362083.1 hypothetical protein [Bacillus subtilis]UQB84304.1 hypothetical protein KMZ31_19475 [Bacillus amyloliquefaciens]WOF32937.1 hypothetical protein OEJ84_22700 [Bacillus subtilis]